MTLTSACWSLRAISRHGNAAPHRQLHAAPPAKALLHPPAPGAMSPSSAAGLVGWLAFHPGRRPASSNARTGHGRRLPTRQRATPPAAAAGPAGRWRTSNLMGVESLAIDAEATRPSTMAGTYTVPSVPNGALLQLSATGVVQQPDASPLPAASSAATRAGGQWRAAGGGSDGRPRAFRGSRNDGLWRSSDRGASFQRVNSFPGQRPATPPLSTARFRQAGAAAMGAAARPVFQLFDPRGGGGGQRTQAIFHVGIATKTRPSLAAQPGRRRQLGIARCHSPTEHRPLRWRSPAMASSTSPTPAEPGPRTNRRAARDLAPRHSHRRLDRHHPGA